MVETFLRQRRLHTAPHHQGGRGPVGHYLHLLSTYCILRVRLYAELQPYYHRGSLASHPHTPGKAFEEKVTSCVPQGKALQISSCVLYFSGPWESQVTKETSKSLKIKAYFVFGTWQCQLFLDLDLEEGALPQPASET